MHVFINFTNRQFWAARQFHWHEIRRRKAPVAERFAFTTGQARAGRAFIFPTPFSARPGRAFGLAREARRQFRSKKVRISSNKRTKIFGQLAQLVRAPH